MAKQVNIDIKQLIEKLKGLKGINLSAVKKYTALMPAAILLAVSGVVFIGTIVVGGKVKQGMSASASTASNIRSVINTVPSREQAKEASAYAQLHSQDLKAVEDASVAASQRELLCYKPVIFPSPKETTSQVYIQYGGNYVLAVDSLFEKMGAKDAPSDSEIRSQIGVGAGVGGMGGMGMMEAVPVASTTTTSSSARVDWLCEDRSNQIPVYGNPETLSWYPYWKSQFKHNNADQSLKDCWYSQMAFWIYEDVAATIQSLNAGSSKVSTSPVKRLLGVRFDRPVFVVPPMGSYGMDMMGMGMGMPMGGGMTGQQTDIPKYVKGYGALVLIPWTNRICNDQIDVVHFAVSVVVDSRYTLSFMKELCSAKQHTYREGFTEDGAVKSAKHNQITILQSEIGPVNRTEPIHAYYRYGNSAVVRLNLIGEYLINRKAIDGIKPDVIWKDQGLTKPAAPADGASAPTDAGGMPPLM